MRYFHLTILLTKHGTLLAYGVNETTPDGFRPSIHSEEAALNKLYRKRKQLNPKLFRKGIILVNFAFTYTGQLRISHPCAKCQKLLARTEFLSEVWYSTRQKDFALYQK